MQRIRYPSGPLGIHLDSASPAEVKLAEVTLQTVKVSGLGAGRPRTRPERIVADKAYDSDPLRQRLGKRGIELIAPHRSNRAKPPTQDGRSLRRYARRWIVERTNAWLQNFRRLVVRYERSALIFLGLIHMACALIALKRVVGWLLVRIRHLILLLRLRFMGLDTQKLPAILSTRSSVRADERDLKAPPRLAISFPPANRTRECVVAYSPSNDRIRNSNQENHL